MEATLRALERCCVCDAYFSPRESAAKRRAHMTACASLRNVPLSRLEEMWRMAGAKALRAARARAAADEAQQTLLTHMTARARTPACWRRLSHAVGMLPDAANVEDATKIHHAVRQHRADVLERLCVTPDTPSPAPARRRARAYDAANATPSWARLLAEWEAAAAHVVPSQRPPRKRRALGVVPSSDDDVPTSRAHLCTDTVAGSDDDGG